MAFLGIFTGEGFTKEKYEELRTSAFLPKVITVINF